MPYEARQPSHLCEVVPIHTKRLLWKMRDWTNGIIKKPDPFLLFSGMGFFDTFIIRTIAIDNKGGY